MAKLMTRRFTIVTTVTQTLDADSEEEALMEIDKWKDALPDNCFPVRSLVEESSGWFEVRL